MSDAKTPKDYRVQDGCWNCPNVFCYFEHDEGDTHYCTFEASKRPRCMSIAMCDEFVFPIGSSEYEKAHAAWDEWSKGREVSPSGTCGNRKGVADV